MPLLPGKKNIGSNIREMSKNHPHNQAVAAALNAAYGPRKHRALGGSSSTTVDQPIEPGQIPSLSNQDQQKAYKQGYTAAQSSYADGGDTDTSDAMGDSDPTVTGPITGTSDGRADDINASVPDGSHILTSDFVSSLGDGNTEAGMDKLEQMFPNSKRQADQEKQDKSQQKAIEKAMKVPSGSKGIKAASAKSAPAIKLNPVKTGAMPHIPAIAKASMSQGAGHNIIRAQTHMPRAPRMPGMPKGLASGGAAKKVKCALSAGEFAVHPTDVANVAGGGSLQRGHEALDNWMMQRRAHQIHKLQTLPPPVK